MMGPAPGDAVFGKRRRLRDRSASGAWRRARSVRAQMRYGRVTRGAAPRRLRAADDRPRRRKGDALGPPRRTGTMPGKTGITFVMHRSRRRAGIVGAAKCEARAGRYDVWRRNGNDQQALQRDRISGEQRDGAMKDAAHDDRTIAAVALHRHSVEFRKLSTMNPEKRPQTKVLIAAACSQESTVLIGSILGSGPDQQATQPHHMMERGGTKIVSSCVTLCSSSSGYSPKLSES
jgi:hypothetical protein